MKLTAARVFVFVVLGATLSACSTPSPDSSSANRSTVEVYGEVDVGVGTQRIYR
ncbi:MAG TPA: hypothetical protein VK026_01395 [Paenalcaligenes sp.]|nr:hypothetical protein [Paenalcaligenes sp.]